MKTMIDPPSGWKYGFPKEIPEEDNTPERCLDWLVEQGYPRSLMDEYGDHFFVRYWFEEDNGSVA